MSVILEKNGSIQRLGSIVLHPFERLVVKEITSEMRKADELGLIKIFDGGNRPALKQSKYVTGAGKKAKNKAKHSASAKIDGGEINVTQPADEAGYTEKGEKE